MKKKLVALLLCIFATVITFSFGGCSESCVEKLFEVPPPTNERILNYYKNVWGINLPENFTIINYAQEAFIQDGEWLYILEYDGYDKEFNNSLNPEADKEFEKKIKDICKDMKKYFNKPYELPDLSNGYFWLYDGIGDETIIHTKMNLLYIPSANQLLAHHLKI